MRVISWLQRIVLVVFVGIPALLVLIDWILQALDAREDNAIVETIREGAELITPEVLATILEDQSHWQTVLFVLIALALLAAIIVLVFALIDRAAVNIRAGLRSDDDDR